MPTSADDYHDLVCLLQPAAPFLSEVQADTLWGMLAWACRWIYGQIELDDFLTLHDDGSPRLLLSDALPDGTLPKPLLPFTARDVKEALPAIGYDEDHPEYADALAVVKQWLEETYLPQEDVLAVLAGERSQLELLRDYLPNALEDRLLGRRRRGDIILLPRRHNRIDRLRGTTLKENGLYTHHQYWQMRPLRVFVRTTFDADWLKPLFSYVAECGFGRRASTGLGQCELVDLRPPADFERLPKIEGADGFVTLSSSYVLSQSESTAGAFFDFHVKRGKLGSAVPAGFVKRPIVMFRRGSVFPSATPAQPWFGRLLDDVHPTRSEVRHYAFAFPLAGKLFAAAAGSTAAGVGTAKVPPPEE